MDLIDGLRSFSSRALKIKDALSNEDMTKTSLVLPFFQLLGYDIFNPLEFVPEFTADVGIKKGEKVDYAIMVDGKPVILIECKSYGEALDKHATQLFRYFSTTNAKFGILTDGITYKFYTDLSEQNKMDLEPFLEFNVLDIPDHTVTELKRFARKSLDVEVAYLAAVELKYTNKMKTLLHNLRAEPSDNFVKYVVGEIYDGGRQTQRVIETFRPIVKRGLSQYINDTIRETLTNAMKSQGNEEIKTETEEQPKADANAGSEGIKPLTDEELEAFAIVKAILGSTFDVNRLSCRNASHWVSVIIDGSISKRICRFWFKRKRVGKSITIMGENRTPARYDVPDLKDIYSYSDQLKTALDLYLSNANLVAGDDADEEDE